MSHPQESPGTSRRELRKALIRLRMEMHRQEIRHESQQIASPLRRVRAMADNLQGGLGIKHGPLWGMAAVVLLGFLTGKGAKGAGSGSLAKWVTLSTSLAPLIKLVMQSPSQKK
ncbi:hypothetical protein [Pseudomonas akapageensis]|uniref:hypothetical protein n=1 Tax=Pseudomonas akapageensis TaxID=2609961 RepID=UPI00140B757B|nr:hypothetical protein [Pseudomonas akapageensis]